MEGYSYASLLPLTPVQDQNRLGKASSQGAGCGCGLGSAPVHEHNVHGSDCVGVFL